MPILLRPYQEAAIQAVRERDRDADPTRRKCVINLPTGTGKTLVAMHMVAKCIANGHRVLWIAHRDELLGQAADAFRAVAPEHALTTGLVKADCNEFGAQLVFASLQTLWQEKRRTQVFDARPEFTLVIADECHHHTSIETLKIMQAVPADAALIGLTATVERGDGDNLGSVFTGGIAYSLPLLVAIRDGYLVPFSACPVRIDGLDLSNVGTVAGDYNQGQLGDAMEEEDVVRATAEAIVTHARERKSLVFTVTVAQAEKTRDELARLGVPSCVVSGETPTDQRRAILRDFRNGTVRAIANCNVLTEGYDEPSADCVVIARPTRSKTLYLQMVGRGLRLAPGKRACLLVDLMGATARHSPIQAAALIDELEREAQVARVHAHGCAPPCDTPRCSCWCHKLHDGVQGMLRADWTPPDWAHWVDIGDGAVAASMPGLNVVVWPESRDESNPNVWRCTAWRKGRGRIDLTPAPVWLDLARGIGEDVLRRAGGAKVAKKNAEWRARPASDGQVSALRKWNALAPDVDPLQMTRGEAADLLTKAISGMQWKKLRKHRDTSRALAFSDAAELDALVAEDGLDDYAALKRVRPAPGILPDEEPPF